MLVEVSTPTGVTLAGIPNGPLPLDQWKRDIIGWREPPPIVPVKQELIIGQTSTSTGSSTGTSDRTHAVSTADGDLIVVYVAVANNSNTSPVVTDDLGGTYDMIGTVAQCTITDTFTLSVHVRTALVIADTYTITAATGANDAGIVGCSRLTNMTKAGASAVRSFGKTDNGSTSSSATVTLNQARLTTNFSVFAVINANPNPSAAPPSGWTERLDVSQTTPNTRLLVYTRANGETSATITSAFPQPTDWAAIGIEFDCGGGDAYLRASAASTNTAGTDPTVTITTAEGDTLLWFVGVAGTDDPSDYEPTDDQGGTYANVLGYSAFDEDASRFLTCFVRRESIASGASTTITLNMTSNDSYVTHVHAVAGLGRVGLNAIRWGAAGLGAASSAPVVDGAGLMLNPLTNWGAPALMFGAVVSGDTSTTAPSAFTELNDTSASTPTIAIETCICVDRNQDSSSVTWGATQSTTWAAIIVELWNVGPLPPWGGTVPTTAGGLGGLIGFSTDWSGGAHYRFNETTDSDPAADSYGNHASLTVEDDPADSPSVIESATNKQRFVGFDKIAVSSPAFVFASDSTLSASSSDDVIGALVITNALPYGFYIDARDKTTNVGWQMGCFHEDALPDASIFLVLDPTGTGTVNGPKVLVPGIPVDEPIVVLWCFDNSTDTSKIAAVIGGQVYSSAAYTTDTVYPANGDPIKFLAQDAHLDEWWYAVGNGIAGTLASGTNIETAALALYEQLHEQALATGRRNPSLMMLMGVS